MNKTYYRCIEEISACLLSTPLCFVYCWQDLQVFDWDFIWAVNTQDVGRCILTQPVCWMILLKMLYHSWLECLQNIREAFLFKCIYVHSTLYVLSLGSTSCASYVVAFKEYYILVIMTRVSKAMARSLYATYLYSESLACCLPFTSDLTHFSRGYIRWDLIQSATHVFSKMFKTPGLKVDLGQLHRSEPYLPGRVRNVAAAEITGCRWSVCVGLYVDRAPPCKGGHTSDHSSSGQAQSNLGVITLAEYTRAHSWLL